MCVCVSLCVCVCVRARAEGCAHGRRDPAHTAARSHSPVRTRLRARRVHTAACRTHTRAHAQRSMRGWGCGAERGGLCAQPSPEHPHALPGPRWPHGWGVVGFEGLRAATGMGTRTRHGPRPAVSSAAPIPSPSPQSAPARTAAVAPRIGSAVGTPRSPPFPPPLPRVPAAPAELNDSRAGGQSMAAPPRHRARPLAAPPPLPPQDTAAAFP